MATVCAASFATPAAPTVTAAAPPAAPSANTASPNLPDNPASLLGLTLAQLLATFGTPDTVYPVRGPEAWQDDVVFHYPDGFSFFIFRDRVWQLRLDTTYHGSIFGMFPGDSTDKILAVLGAPDTQTDDTWIYRLPEQGYPVRLRLSIADAKVEDFYVYRGDF